MCRFELLSLWGGQWGPGKKAPSAQHGPKARLPEIEWAQWKSGGLWVCFVVFFSHSLGTVKGTTLKASFAKRPKMCNFRPAVFIFFCISFHISSNMNAISHIQSTCCISCLNCSSDYTRGGSTWFIHFLFQIGFQEHVTTQSSWNFLPWFCLVDVNPIRNALGLP